MTAVASPHLAPPRKTRQKTLQRVAITRGRSAPLTRPPPAARPSAWEREDDDPLRITCEVDVTPAVQHERLHVLQTTPVPYVRDVQTTGRLEDKLIRKVRRQHRRSWVLGVAAVVAMGLVGACVGYLFAAVVAVAWRV